MVVLAKKLIQLKDSAGNLVYPVYIPQEIPNKVDILLDTPLYSKNAINDENKTTLLKNYTDYDIIACRVGVNTGTEGVWVFFFPKTNSPLITQFYMRIYNDNYYGSGKIRLSNNNQIGIIMQYQTGWNYNSWSVSKVIGIKLT